MKTYVAMLRGINVSGQKKIKMADLRSYLEELDFLNVQTYIQSGNVVFDYAPVAHKQLEDKILNQIKVKYDFHVPTLVKSKEDFEYVVNHNPFLKDPENDTESMYVTFLSDVPDTALSNKLAEVKFDHEQYVLDGKYIYLHVPKGYGNTKMSNNFFESKLKVSATSRNWRTVNKLLDMAINADANS